MLNNMGQVPDMGLWLFTPLFWLRHTLFM